MPGLGFGSPLAGFVETAAPPSRCASGARFVRADFAVAAGFFPAPTTFAGDFLTFALLIGFLLAALAGFGSSFFSVNSKAGFGNARSFAAAGGMRVIKAADFIAVPAEFFALAGRKAEGFAARATSWFP
jgi:hypothetical protein